jgi:hypothetical protein
MPWGSEENVSKSKTENTVEPGYNDIGLYDTSPIASEIVVPINSSLLNITLQYSVIITLVYNDTKYSVLFMTL